MIELVKAKLVAEAASAELAVAARNEQIRKAVHAGVSVREIESATGVPRSTVHRIGSADPLAESEYLRLANNAAISRAEVIALESVEAMLAEPGSATDAA